MRRKQFLDKTYDLDSAEATRQFYNEWSANYDAEIVENGYATPARCASALKEFADKLTSPLLDIGCGTGMSGTAFRDAGFSTIDGADFSAEMLAEARKKDIYRALVQTDLANPFPFAAGQYANIAAVGVLNPGHAPAETLDSVIALLPRGGCFVFSLNDHAMRDGSYEGRICEYVDAGSAQLVFREYGDHLPKIGLKSNVYVLKRQ